MYVCTESSSLMNILLTIDVEDWFQVENLRPWVPFRTWDSRELRVERNTHALLDLFDDIRLDAYNLTLEPKNFAGPESDLALLPAAPDSPVSLSPTRKLPGEKRVQCTFFILGWLAERLPQMVREIAARGHEVACHGYKHQMCTRLSEADLRNDLGSSKRLLEDITGVEVAGFRAPNFSIDDRILATIRDCGYRYDSSYNSFSLHGRYGRIALNGGPKAGIGYKLGDHFFELPVSNLPIFRPSATSGNRNFHHLYLPWSGGAYFRLMPLSLFKRGIRFILKRCGAYAFYIHPWEVDPGQPKIQQASFGSRFKHYTNLRTTEDKLRKMIDIFSDCHFVGCRQYIEEKALCSRD